MKQIVQITLECESKLVGEILAAANFAAKKHGNNVIVTTVEEKKGSR